MARQIYCLVIITFHLNLNAMGDNNIKPEPKPESMKSNYIPEIYAGVSPILEKESKAYVKKELKKKYTNLTGKKNKKYGIIKGD